MRNVIRRSDEAAVANSCMFRCAGGGVDVLMWLGRVCRDLLRSMRICAPVEQAVPRRQACRLCSGDVGHPSRTLTITGCTCASYLSTVSRGRRRVRSHCIQPGGHRWL